MFNNKFRITSKGFLDQLPSVRFQFCYVLYLVPVYQNITSLDTWFAARIGRMIPPRIQREFIQGGSTVQTRTLFVLGKMLVEIKSKFSAEFSS